MNKPAVISTRVDAELLTELDRIASAHRRSRAWLVNEAVRRYTQQESELLELIEEGERSLREGGTISGEQMTEWIAVKRAEIAAMRKKGAA